ncbi:MAG: hypothetical protein EPN97_16095 [Alphaproteobacteria bacterium]|nr:MAG: hypothetical protein EPN97_16095 [Alphaproteobacteria bacterium]
MAEYTPELDKLISDYGNFFEKQLKDMLNPKTNAVASTLRIAFRMKTTGVPLRDKIFAKTGWDVANETEKHLAALVEMAEQNGSRSGDKLKAALPVYIQMTQALEHLPDDTSIIKGIRHAKKLNLAF